MALKNNERQVIRGEIIKRYTRRYPARADDSGMETAYRMAVRIPDAHRLIGSSIIHGTVPRNILSGIEVGDWVEFSATLKLDSLGLHGRFRRPSAATLIAKSIANKPRTEPGRAADGRIVATLHYYQTLIGR